MVRNYVILLVLFLCNIHLAVSATYSCDHSAKCGCSKADVVIDKIVGGEASVRSSWGWAVSLQEGFRHFCGGAIISRTLVITAAHCVDDPVETVMLTQVVAGIYRLNDSRSGSAQVRSISTVFLHPRYDEATNANDIAVLQLSQPLDISDEKGTALLCIPQLKSNDSMLNYPIVDSSLVAIGWGTLYSGQISIPSGLELQQVTVNALAANHRMCSPSIKDPKVQFCAGVVGGGKDTCQGDSGGPLMHFNTNTRQWVLTGLTSYGQGCALPDHAGVYTRASAYMDWLRSLINDNFVELIIEPGITTAASTVRTTTTVRPNESTKPPISGVGSLMTRSFGRVFSLYGFFISMFYIFAAR